MCSCAFAIPRAGAGRASAGSHQQGIRRYAARIGLGLDEERWGRPRKPVAERIACSHYTGENAHCALRATKQLSNGDKVCSFHFSRQRPEPLNTYPLGQTFGRPRKEQLTRQAVAKSENNRLRMLRQRVRLRRQSITLGKVLLAGVLASAFLLNEFPRPKLHSRPHLYVESANQKPTHF